ncbi:DUF4145 domain-containing protein [Lysinibacillus sp. FSL K6-0075]|uniref:DUF4145 domain-containing protein n=1 Tax=Lysinibacillus sp. FSL K6-0075 TaxID=2921415 RepID=UPI003158E68E
MNTNELISSLVNSLAWPVSLIVSIWILKRPLNKLLSTITRVKYNEIEIDFGEALDRVAENLDVSNNENNETLSFVQEDPAIHNIAKTYPSALIIMGFSKIEIELNNIIDNLDIPGNRSSRRYNPIEKIDLLRKQGILDKDLAKSINELRHLRNEAVHLPPSETNITTENALEYYQLSEKVISDLQQSSNK